MKNIHIGMFIEQNKNRLLPEDLSNAQKALTPLPDKTIRRILETKTKSPICATFLATFFGWIGGDSFYLGKTSTGIARIIATIISIGLYISCHFLFTMPLGDIFPIDLSQIKIDFSITAEMVKYAALAITLIYSVAYLVKLIINIVNAETNAKVVNKKLYKLRLAPKTIVENVWHIG